jgi:DNA polymerase-1
MFVPTDSYSFLDGDFSQLELRVVAYLSQEPVMIQAFEQGRDIHTSVMADIKGLDYDELCSIIGDDARKIPPNKTHGLYSTYKEERVAIKRINFGIVYGVGASRLQRLLKLELKLLKDLEWCQDLIDTWLKKYSKVALWLEQQRQFAIGHKFVRMPFGQKRRLPDAADMRRIPKEMRAFAGRALRQATNFPVQSMASWICLIGMIITDQYFQDNPEIDGHIILQVHDSVTSEVKNNEWGTIHLENVAQDIQNIMEKETIRCMKEYFGINFNVPLSFPVKVLARWE